MKICIFGAGAIGGHLAAGLSDVEDVELSLVARDPHLAAIKENGLMEHDRPGARDRLRRLSRHRDRKPRCRAAHLRRQVCVA